MLLYKADRKTIIFISTFLGVLIFNWNQESLNLPVYLLHLVLALPIASISHNHHHINIWKNKYLNFLQDYVLSFCYGMTSFSWVAVHNQGHHRYHNEEGKDITSTHSVGDTMSFRSLFLYPVVNIIPFLKYHKTFFSDLERPKDKNYFIIQYIIIWSLVALLLFLDWRKTIVLVFIPQIVAICSISIFNYSQHVHTKHDEIYEVTRNFTNPFLNWYLFNCGFHTIHHLKPTLHWSLVPQEQRNIDGNIRDELQVQSFWAFLLGELRK